MVAFSHIQSHWLIFDTETQLFYELPRFTSALIRAPSDSDSSDPATRVRLTNTRMISLSHHFDRTISLVVGSTLFQAFIIPTDSLQVYGIGVLRLTHEGTIPIQLPDMDLIRNSIVNPLTGVTSIRFLHQDLGIGLHFSCIDLTLPNHTSTDAILPITTDSHDITVVHDVPFISTPAMEHHIIFSDDGHVRGLWISHVMRNGSETLANMRCTIDASRDKYVAVLGQISVPLLERNLLDFSLIDLVRGIICYSSDVIRGDHSVFAYIK